MVVPGAGLRDPDGLPGVPREVLDHVQDGAEDRRFHALDVAGRLEVGVVDGLDRPSGLADGLPELREKTVTVAVVRVRELARALAVIGRTGEPRENPLTDVAFEMPQDDADRQRRTVRCPPQVALRERVDRGLEPGHIDLLQVVSALADEDTAHGVTSNWISEAAWTSFGKVPT